MVLPFNKTILAVTDQYFHFVQLQISEYKSLFLTTLNMHES